VQLRRNPLLPSKLFPLQERENNRSKKKDKRTELNTLAPSRKNGEDDVFFLYYTRQRQRRRQNVFGADAAARYRKKDLGEKKHIAR